MITTSKLKRILSDLSFEGVARVPVANDLEVELQISEDHSKMKMSAAVYHGTDFIPKSIRRCIQGPQDWKPHAESKLSSFLLVDERNFRINLNYVCEWPGVKEHRFVDLLEEFSWQVEEWHRYIHGIGEGDLVFIHSRNP